MLINDWWFDCFFCLCGCGVFFFYDLYEKRLGLVRLVLVEVWREDSLKVVNRRVD